MTVVAEVAPAASVPEWDARTALVARYLVDAGKVVASASLAEDGRARSWWLPLPGAGDRDVLAGMLEDDTLEAHQRAARGLAEAVDDLVRVRLAGASHRFVTPRAGRRTVPYAWLESLACPDPWLAPSLPAAKVAAFVDAVSQWAAAGAAQIGRSRLCIRVHEPADAEAAQGDGGPERPAVRADAELAEHRGAKARADSTRGGAWWLELLVQDADEPSLVVTGAELWAGRAPLPPGSMEEVLAALARTAAIAPPLAPLLDMAAPDGLALETAELVGFVEQHLDALAEIGVAILLPTWWTRRPRLSLRARAAAGAAPAQVTAGGLDFDRITTFTLEAALGGERLTKADLALLRLAAEAKQPLVLLRGQWTQIDAGHVLAVLARVGEKGKATVGELVRASIGIGALDATDGRHGRAAGAIAVTGEEPMDVVSTGWLGQLLDDVRSASVEPQRTPDGFVGALRPYQERGVGWLVFLGRLGIGACLADDMGLGKTAQLIATLIADPTPGPTLVVSPVSVLGNWARELERFAPHLRVLVHHGADRFGGGETFAERAAAHDVVLSTYSLCARDTEHLRAVPWGRLVLDEAQQIKNPATTTARAIRQIDALRRVALTGTPVENRLSELWSIMHCLNPGLLGSLAGFTRRFAQPIERDHDDQAAATLKRIVGPFLLRRLKTDRSIIDDLPDKIEQTERCPLTREQATLYQAVVNEMLEAAEREDGIGRSGAILAGISKLKQVCNHPAHFLGDRSPLPGRSGKLDRVEELLDEIVDAGDKVLCFTQFAEWGTLLASHFTKRYGTEPLWLHGGVPRRARDDMTARFQDPEGPPIFLLSLKAGGTGLNLTAASHVIHLDRWWNPAVEDQATDRAYRIGQRRAVLVHKLVSTGTIEERIDEMIAEKRALAERVVGSGEQWITKLDTAALRDVVALRSGEED